MNTDEIWEKCLEIALNEEQIPGGLIESSLRGAATELVGDQLIVRVSFNADRVVQYQDYLKTYLTQACERNELDTLGLQIVEKEGASQEALPDLTSAPQTTPQNLSPDFNYPGKFKPTFTFENFVSGDSSRIPLEACKSIAEDLGNIFNPLFLYGDVGLGKTHLLHAIGNYVKEHYPRYKCLYSTTDRFISSFVMALRENEMENFRNTYRNVDVLLLDDIQFLEKGDAVKNELFYTLSELEMSGKQIMLAADRRPKDLDDIPERLKSRFMSGLVIDIRPPDLETRIAILRLKTKNLYPDNIEIADTAYSYIAENFTQNIRELEGALTRVIALSRIERQEKSDSGGLYISLIFAQNALSDLVNTSDSKPLTPTRILEVCSKYSRCEVEALIGPRRNKQITSARHMTMYALRQITDLSYPQIGEIFGGRDHSTVMHAVRKIETNIQVDKALFNQINDLLKILKTKNFRLEDVENIA